MLFLSDMLPSNSSIIDVTESKSSVVTVEVVIFETDVTLVEVFGIKFVSFSFEIKLR